MPIYEYQCLSCKNRFQYLIIKKDDEKNLFCPECKGEKLKKLISLVAFHLSEQDRLGTFTPGSSKDDAFYKDTRNIGLNAKKKAQQMGIDLGSDFDAKVDRLRTNPDSVFDTQK